MLSKLRDLYVRLIHARQLVAGWLFWLAATTPALAGESSLKKGLSWGLVILCVGLGLLITLQPVKRESEIKDRRR